MSEQPQLIAASPYPQPGDVLDGKYRVERLLGEGGMGAVAKATHLLRRAPVALKFMSPAVIALQGAVDRFVNEGVAASQIDSDHVVKVFDVGRLPSGAPYLVMEFLDGADLAQILERDGGRLPAPRAVHFTLQILRALQTAHAAGIIHRDMKPSNCFVIEKDGEPDFVKLVDFGISKVRSEEGGAPQANLTRTNSALGTPLYMSPEQARSARDVDHRADLYSVGAILYELLSGRTPYTADSGQFTEILYKIFTTDPEPLRGLRPDVSEGLAAVVHRALARDPEQRYRSAVEMAEALEPFADERSQTLLSRLRGGRSRSLVPPRPGGLPISVVPAAPSYGEAAMANTFPGEPARSAKVQTDVGMTKEAAPSEGRSGRAPIALAVGAMAMLGLAAAGALVLRHGSGTPATTEPAPVALSAPTPAPSPPPVRPEPAPSAALVPLPAPSAAPPPSASARAALKSVTPAPPVTPPPATTASPGSKPPSTLGGIQLH